MNKTIKTKSLLSFLFMILISTVHGQITEEQEEAIKHNIENDDRMREAELEDGFSIFNSTNLKISFTCIGYENLTDELEPYKPQKENFEDISGKYVISYESKDRKQYSPDYSPEYIEFKPTPDSKPVRVLIEYGSYTCYVFYISEGQLKLGRHNN